MTATTKNIPGKRLKTWHRRHVKESKPFALSLRAFARQLLAGNDEHSRETARKWAGGKVAK